MSKWYVGIIADAKKEKMSNENEGRKRLWKMFIQKQREMRSNRLQ